MWSYFSGGAKIWPPGDNYYHTYLLPMAPLAVSFNCDYQEHVLDSHRIIGPQFEDRCDALVVAQITVAPQIRGLLSRSLTRRRIDQAEGASDNCMIRKLRYALLGSSVVANDICITFQSSPAFRRVTKDRQMRFNYVTGHFSLPHLYAKSLICTRNP